MLTQDTIAALSTAATPAARIIVRLAGPLSHRIAIALVGGEHAPSSATHAFLSFNGVSFPGWIYAFRGPHSYTGDDLIEFHIPGSPVLAKWLLDELFKHGARSAEPGEFTARAYFNGKLDLTEAEGVAATIAAGNEAELRAARQLLAGELARRLNPIMDGLAQTLALIEVGIDFSEEEVTFLAADEVARRIRIATDLLDDLVEQSNRFEALTHEPRIVLAGRPNAGKSSLINALTGGHRAIVSDTAGTTRDVLTAPLDLPRGRVILTDVAGLETSITPDTSVSEVLRRPGSTGDESGVEESGASEYLRTGWDQTDAQSQIDRQMQSRAHAAIQSADHLVLVKDSTDDRPAVSLPRAPDLLVLSKADLVTDRSQLPGLGVSSRTGNGMKELREALDHMAFGSITTISTLALNRRHLVAIADARAALDRGSDRVHDDAAELVAAEVREALDHLGHVLGSITPDDVLGRVFSAFCIGK